MCNKVWNFSFYQNTWSPGSYRKIYWHEISYKFQHLGIKNENFVVIFKFSRSLTKAKTAHFFGHFETQKAQNSLSNHPALFSWLLRTKFQHPGFKNEDFLIYFEFMRSMVQKVQKNLLRPCFFNILRPKTPQIC